MAGIATEAPRILSRKAVVVAGVVVVDVGTEEGGETTEDVVEGGRSAAKTPNAMKVWNVFSEEITVGSARRKGV